MVERILPFFQRKPKQTLVQAPNPNLYEGLWPDRLKLCQLSASEADAITLTDAKTGILITGQTGRGKTSGPGRLFAKAYLRAGFGGLVLCAKSDEPDLWRSLLKQTGREKDGIFFGEDPSHCFNFLDYEAQVSGSDLAENIVNLMIELARITNPGVRGGDNAEFWQAERKKLLRNIIGLLLPVDGSVDLLRMNSLLNSAPHDFNQARSADWRSSSKLYKYVVAAEQLVEKGKIRKHEYELMADYWLGEHPGDDPRTRGNIVSDYTGLMDAFLRGKMYDIFSKNTTVSPDDILAGKVVVVALPVAGYYEVGRYAAGVWKYLLQRASERRSLVNRETIRPSFIWADEAQYFSTSTDQIFQTTARSARVCTVFLTQNLPNFYVEFGGSEVGTHRVHSLLGNLAIKIFCGNDDNVTNEWAARTIDKSTQYKLNVSNAQELGRDSIGLSEHDEFDCPSRTFLGLKFGTEQNDYIVEAIAFQGGRIWSNGRRWMKCSFRQNY
jgi:hypothetical protein